jgi:Mrp family chromosome partitioning ATPase
MALGGLFILFLERRNHGFRTDTELTNATNVPCLAMLPETTKAPSDTMSIYAEAARAITAATGLVTKPGGSKVVLVTSCLPDEGKTLLCAVLAGTLVDTGRRTLIIDLSPPNQKCSVPPAAEALEEVIKAMEGGVSPLRALRGAPFAILHRSSGDETSPHLVTSPVFSKLLTEARDIYDVVLIEVPPVMLVADALYLGRSADVVLHVVRWNRTPRLAVAAALRAIRNLGIRVDAMVLSRVDPVEYRRYTGVDPRRYFRPRRKYLPARSPEQLPAKDEKPKLAGAASRAF